MKVPVKQGKKLKTYLKPTYFHDNELLKVGLYELAKELLIAIKTFG
jgi:hypothetical protein